MQPHKILAIINPISGIGGKGKMPALIKSKLDAERFDLEVVFTERPGHATLLAQDAAADGCDIVLAVGGDGTINEVGRALCGTDTALAILPCGSGNGLARHLHIPMNAEKALETLNNGVIDLVDYGTVNNHPFFCTCGVGFDAQVSYKFANEDTRGLVTYIKTTISEYFRYRAQHYRITIDGSTIEEKAFVIACCNAAQYGNNALVAPRASMQDGKIDLTVIHSFNLGEAALLSARLFTSNIDRDRHVSIYRGRDIIIERDDEDVMHIDGDPVMMPEVLHITCHPSAMRVVVPASNAVI
ncbi:MAG: diacylglycerol kinase family lipid kinase [Muribaculaceae bacterium]|nr:diacylglycerol kinase family lipid kinase [Muribaculaceae bacterium]